jgi:hypothetical protein
MGQSVLSCQVHDDHEAHILRRIGAAVALHWADLPEDFQELLLEAATLPGNPYEPAEFEQQIKWFVSSYSERCKPTTELIRAA